MILAALLGLVIGPLADHYGYSRTLMVGMVAATCSTLATGLTPTYAFLLAVAVAGAIGRAAVQPAAQATVAVQFHGEQVRRHAMSRVQMGNSGAAIVGIPLMTLIAAYGGWRVAFLILAVLGFLSLAILGHSSLPTSRLVHGDCTFARCSPATSSSSSTARPELDRRHADRQHRGLGRLELPGGVPRGGPRLLAPGRRLGLPRRRGGVMVGTMISGTRLGAHPRPIMIWSRSASAVLLACAMVPPLSVWPWRRSSHWRWCSTAPTASRA